MKCIISPFNSCYKNIGSEEYFMSHFDEDIFYLYINKPCIVIGKNQNAYTEINQDYIKSHNIDVVRRRSGGGAVFHDMGNLNFGFITKDVGQNIDDVFKEYTKPVLEVINNLGVAAKFSGRNDLVIDDKKISGNAQFRASGKVLQHGTLLFDSDIGSLSNALNASPLKFQDKSTKSVKSRVTNIINYLPKKITIEEFSSAIMVRVLEKFPNAHLYALSADDIDAITKLAEEKYSSWEWVYGSSPSFTYETTFRYDKGTVDIRVDANNGVINHIYIYGDFFGKKDVEELAQALVGISFQKSSIEEALASIDPSEYIWGLSKEHFIQHLIES